MATVVQEAADMARVSSEVAEAYADCWDFFPERDGYGPGWAKVERRRSLDFLATKWLPRDDAKWVMQQWVKGYNAFDPSLLDHLPAKAQVRIAREGSVAIYVRGSQRTPTAATMQADERHVVNLLGVPCVRYWWD